jgi:hypothetical protein
MAMTVASHASENTALLATQFGVTQNYPGGPAMPTVGFCILDHSRPLACKLHFCKSTLVEMLLAR